MQVTNVRVSFLREKQPAQYEKAQPMVEFAATLDQGDDHRLVARSLMIDATSVVYAGIGYAVPVKVAQALLDGDTPDKLDVTVETTEVPPEAPETAETAKPKTRGRPKGSTNTAPKKETAAAKRKREATETAKMQEMVTGNIMVPGEGEFVYVAFDAEGRPRPVPEDEVPGDDEVPETMDGTTEFTSKDLHTLIMSHVNATPRTLSVANAKQVLAHFKVARAQDLTTEQAVEGKALVEKMVEATVKQGG